MPVLQAFIVKFNEEEERELQKIKDRLGEKLMQFTALSFTFEICIFRKPLIFFLFCRYCEYKKHLQAIVQEVSSKS